MFMYNKISTQRDNCHQLSSNPLKMRKKLLSIQNMRSMIMEQTLRKQNYESNTEILTINEFRQKLQKLLEKVTIQTNYTNRVSQYHLKNIDQLQSVKKELNHLLQLRKIEENNEIMLKNLSNQLAQTLNQTKQKLLIVTNQLFGLRKQLKQTKIELLQLKKTNQNLEIELRRTKRQKYIQMVELHAKDIEIPLSKLIEDYLKDVKSPQSQVLYQHCVQTLRTKRINNFIKELQQKINSRLQMKPNEIVNRNGQKSKQTQKLMNLIIKKKISNIQFQSYGQTSHQRKKTKLSEDGCKLSSFRMRTQGSTSMQKYSLC